MLEWVIKLPEQKKFFFDIGQFRQRRLEKLDLNITNRCNFRCIHCCFESGEKKMAEMSLEHIVRVLEDAKELGAWRIDVTGGETMVREDVYGIIAAGKKLGYRIELLTNGSLLSWEKLQRLKDIGLDAIGISLDGSTNDVHSRIRKTTPDTYDRIIENIKYAVELGFYTKVNSVVFKSNIYDIPAITRKCVELGVQEHGIYYFTPIGRGNDNRNEVIDPREWLGVIRNNIAAIPNINQEGGLKVSVEYVLVEKQHVNTMGKRCFVGKPHHLQILPDGMVYPCAIMASYGISIGSLHDESLKDIWNDEKRWIRYAEVLENLFGRCRGCVDYREFSHDGFRRDDYSFVCPCTKYKPQDIAEAVNSAEAAA